MTTPGWDPTQQGNPAGANQAGFGPQPSVAQPEQLGQAGVPGQVGHAVAPGVGETGAPVPPGYPMQPAGMPMEQPPAGYGQPGYGAPVPQPPYGPGGPGGPGGPVPPYGQPPYPPPPGFRPKSGNKGLLIGVCSVLAAALVGGGVYLALAGNDDDSGPSSASSSGGSGGTKTEQKVDTPTAAATFFLDALKNNDVSTAAKFACMEFKQEVQGAKLEDGVTFSYKILGTETISDTMTHVRVNERFEKDGTVQEQSDQILIVTKDPEGYRVCGEQQPELNGG